MGLLRTIAILLAVILILNLIRKYVTPIVKAANNINEKAKKEKNTITYVNSSKKSSNASNEDDGEYIEYKEIK